MLYIYCSKHSITGRKYVRDTSIVAYLKIVAVKYYIYAACALRATAAETTAPADITRSEEAPWPYSISTSLTLMYEARTKCQLMTDEETGLFESRARHYFGPIH